MRLHQKTILSLATCALALLMTSRLGDRLRAQAGPTMLAPNLAVSTVVSGLTTQTSMALLGANDFFVLEKSTGKVQRVINGVIQVPAPLDLGVNSSSERGLLGIALHPRFPATPYVYLYWTCQVAPPPSSDPFHPTAQECPDPPTSSVDSPDILGVPLLGNRVDRFLWNGATLTYDRNLIKLHAFQNDGSPMPEQGDSTQRPAGNHNGGVLRFGPDGKLYIFFGDNGRRGKLQNLAAGPTPPLPDDQFGGPDPDNAHFSGVILRLNDDGTTPADNPFFNVTSGLTGEAAVNVKKIFAYGFRNSFGMAFDQQSGNLWVEVNGDDTFDEIDRIEPGMNSGWVQIMGPSSRIGEFKSLETTLGLMNLQQLRWPPARIADSPQEALDRLFMLPGAHYKDPEFSWKFAVAPAGIGFMTGRGIGPQYEGDLFVGASTPTLAGGYLFHFQLAGNRRTLGVDDRRLNDKVADNVAKFDITESESLLIGRDFGIGTDIQTGPNGNLFVVSLSNGAVYEIRRQ